MMKLDRTVKMLLMAVVILLGILVVKPLIKLTPAIAQTTQSEPTPTVTGFRLQEVGTVVLPAGKKPVEVQVIDSAQAFLVRYEDHIQVYRVQDVNINPATLQRLRGNSNSLPFQRL